MRWFARSKLPTADELEANTMEEKTASISHAGPSSHPLPPKSAGHASATAEAQTDSETGPPIPVPSAEIPSDGYPRIAYWVGTQPGFAVFRRFARLNAQNLLYLQSEISILEYEIDRMSKPGPKWKDEREFYQYEVYNMKNAAEGTPGARLWKKILELREKLREYNALLLDHEKLFRLPKPNKHDLDRLRTIYRDDNHCASFLPLPEDLWLHEDQLDLVALSSRREIDDSFSKLLTDTVMPWFFRQIGYRTKKPLTGSGSSAVYSYSDSKLNRIAENVSLIVGSTLPPLTVIILYYIPSVPGRLAFIVAFSALFSACLAFFTGARRVEIFAAAVALGSVQVVFVGTSL